MVPAIASSESKIVDNDTEEIVQKKGPMEEMLAASPARPEIDDVVEGPVVAIGRARVFVDLAPFGTGIIYGREYLSARDALKNVNIGDIVTAKVVGSDNDEGYIEL